MYKFRQLQPWKVWWRGAESLSYGYSFMMRTLIQTGMILTALGVITPIPLSGNIPNYINYLIVATMLQYGGKMWLDDFLRSFMGFDIEGIVKSRNASHILTDTDKEVLKQAPYFFGQPAPFGVTIEKSDTTNSIFLNSGTVNLITRCLVYNTVTGLIFLKVIGAGNFSDLMSSLVILFWANIQARQMNMALRDSFVRGVAEDQKNESAMSKFLRFQFNVETRILSDSNALLPIYEYKKTKVNWIDLAKSYPTGGDK